MNTENLNNAEPGRVPPTSNAISIYGQNDAMDDFPVLKAFQQYIDAEQAKAQKRMTTLCIFFAILMAIVVGVFVALLVNMAQDKNRVNDQLIQFMLKDRERQPVVAPPSANDATVKAITESMANLQKQLADQQLKMVEQQNKLFEQRAEAAEHAAAVARQAKAEIEAEISRKPPSQTQLDLAKKNQSDIAKIKKAHSLLLKQKEELEREKERLRQKEIELQRRKLYPELYEPKKTVGPKPGINHLVDPDEDDDLDEDLDEVKPTTPPPPAAKPKQNADGSLSYFDDDEFHVPAESQGSTAGWRMPLD